MVQMNKPVILDVRERDEYEAEHVEGSILAPLSLFATHAPGILTNLRGRDLVLLCRSGNRARMAQQQVEALGFSRDFPAITVFEGGIVRWKELGRPTVSSRKSHLPILRQVQLIAGGATFAFSTLAIFVNPIFSWGAAFFGFGLTVAGLTGFCGMANVLAYMPWNRSNPTNREELCAVSPGSGGCNC
jgi:rhodanese-related sulfurtransferase